MTTTIDPARIYEPFGAAKALMSCRDKEVLVEGPAGCVAGETLLWDPATGTHRRFDDLYSTGDAPTVLTMYGPVKASPVFAKGVARLYRVTLESGRSCVVMNRHRFLTRDGWAFVSDLSPGMELRSVLPEGALRSMRTRVGSLSDCPTYRRLCDEQPRWAEADDRACERRGCDAPEPDRDDSLLGGLASTQASTRSCLCADHHAMLGSGARLCCETSGCSRSEAAVAIPDAECHAALDRPEHAACLCQQPSQSHQVPPPLSPSEPRCHGCGNTLTDDLCESWYPCPDDRTGWDPIASIEYVRTDVYYDLHVPDAEHYLADGIWSHNTGKSRGVATKLHVACQKYKGCRCLMVRKTRASMTESILVTYEQKVCPPGAPWVQGVTRRTRQSYIYPNTGAVLATGGMDNIDRIMSSEWDIIAVFEGTELSEAEFETLTTRLRNGKIPYQQIIVDCNPSYPEHWLNKRAESGRMKRLLSRHADNPSVTPEYLETLSNLTGPRRDRLFLGKWASAEGIVYEGFDRAIHAVQSFQIPDSWRRFRVIDFGFTNPFVCQWWAMDPDGRVYLYREIYHSQRLVSDHAARINELSMGERYDATIADHDAEGRETLAAAGIHTIPANKAKLHGIQLVSNRLKAAGDGKPRLYIMLDACLDRDQKLVDAGKPTSCLGEIDSYAWQPPREGRAAKEEPLDENNHSCDAMRYLCAHIDAGLPSAAWVQPAIDRGGEQVLDRMKTTAELIEDDSVWSDV